MLAQGLELSLRVIRKLPEDPMRLYSIQILSLNLYNLHSVPRFWFLSLLSGLTKVQPPFNILFLCLGLPSSLNKKNGSVLLLKQPQCMKIERTQLCALLLRN